MKSFIAIAPTYKLDHLSSDYMNLLFHSDIAMEGLRAVGPKLPMEPLIDPQTTALIFDSYLGINLIFDYMKWIVEPQPELVSLKALEVWLNFYPAGASFKLIDHIRQIVVTGETKKYDYGIDENIERYG